MFVFVRSFAFISRNSSKPRGATACATKNGILQQLIALDGSQLEAPDPWLNNQNPWELPRLDVQIEIRFYGHAERIGNGMELWSGG